MCSIMGFLSPRLDAETVKAYFDRTVSRGPDQSRIEPAGSGFLCFHIAIPHARVLAIFSGEGYGISHVPYAGIVGCDDKLAALGRIADASGKVVVEVFD